ncbi:ABC transporter substrate-binding protein [Thermofilum pendens]|uniref:Extracellular solute-binding protein, family 1 n=1 Tax=Thermofilum pendens (strain DSM 2475 / Hrk 5) TaxID=368408 RepID=A1S173_THEPD|nr:ABC transporter substrate-binding protein [Thermofilum pendens]ABL79203.1 extracellular solute-binding protein, family 1 [Thermofilum pendens Hrk 5]
MNSKVLLVLAVLVLVALGVALVVLQQKAPPSAPPANQTQQPSPGPVNQTPSTKPPANQTQQPPAGEGITLYVITRHEQTIQDLTRTMFLSSSVAKKYNIKNIVFLPINAEQWPDYIKNAAQKGQGIDVAWGGGPTLFNLIDDMGLIEPIDLDKHPEFKIVMDEVAKLPKTIAGAETYKVGSDGKIHWIGASVSSFGFTVNRDLLNRYKLPMPQRWADLGNPAYAVTLPALQLVGIADPTMSTSNTRIFEIILQAYGWDKGWRTLTLIAANSKIFSGSSDVRDAVIRGDIAIGTTIDFYGYTAQQQNPSCLYIIPPGESIVNADPIAILKGSRHPEAAAAFVAWVLNETGGQLVWLDPNINRLPINPRVFDTPQGARRPDLKKALEDVINAGGIAFNESLSSAWVTAVVDYFKATLVNAHDDLQPVWAQIVKAYRDKKITEAQFQQLVTQLTDFVTFTDPLTGQQTTFTLDYAIKISPKLASDPSIYQRLMNDWTSAARAKYLKVQSLLKQMTGG